MAVDEGGKDARSALLELVERLPAEWDVSIRLGRSGDLLRLDLGLAIPKEAMDGLGGILRLVLDPDIDHEAFLKQVRDRVGGGDGA